VFVAAGIIVILVVLILALLGRWCFRGRPRHPGEDESGGAGGGAAPPQPSVEGKWGDLGLLGGVLLAAGLAAWWRLPGERVARFFLDVRAPDVGAGMSRMVRMGMLGGAVFARGFCGMRQAGLARRVRLTCPFMEKSWKAIHDADQKLTNGLE